MVSSDMLVDGVKAEDLSCHKCHIFLVLFFDVILHRMAEDVAILYNRQVDVPRVPRLHQLRPTAAIERGLIPCFHVGQNSLHTIVEAKLTDGVEREVLHRDLSIGGGEVSTLNDLIIVWRQVVSANEKAKLVDVHI